MAPHIIRFLDFPCREKKLYMLCPGVAVREAIKVPWTTHKQVVICPSLQGMCFTTNRLEHINIRSDCSESVTYNKLTDLIKFVAWTSPIDINGTGHGTVYLYCLETQGSLDKCHYFVPLPDAQHLWGWPGHLTLEINTIIHIISLVLCLKDYQPPLLFSICNITRWYILS